jgi:hypothetical protein
MMAVELNQAKGIEEIADTEALFALGMRYSTGQGVPVDLVQAHQFFNVAALRGDLRARDCRAELAREMSAAEIAEAQRRAREWLRVH